MSKIVFIKGGCLDRKTGEPYEIGQVVDLGVTESGIDRNSNAVEIGVAEWVEDGKEVSKPKAEPCAPCSGKKKAKKDDK